MSENVPEVRPATLTTLGEIYKEAAASLKIVVVLEKCLEELLSAANKANAKDYSV